MVRLKDAVSGLTARQREALAARLQVRRVGGQLRVGIAEEDQIRLPLVHRAAGHEQHLRQPLRPTPHFAEDLARNLAQHAVRHARDADFSRQRRNVLRRETQQQLDRLRRPFQAQRLVEMDRLEEPPARRPVPPRGRQRRDVGKR